MNRRRRGGVHGGMNRPDMYMKQLAAQAAWFRAQGDDEAAAIADELAERIHDHHEGVLDETTPEWANGEVVDEAPAIRCWPATGVVLRGEEGRVLTIDPMDGGDVMIVHLGDVARYLEDSTRAAGEAEAADDRARQSGDAEVGEIIDAEFEVDEDTDAGDENAGPYSAMHADEQLSAEGPDDVDLTGDADDGSEDSGEDDEGFV